MPSIEVACKDVESMLEKAPHGVSILLIKKKCKIDHYMLKKIMKAKGYITKKEIRKVPRMVTVLKRGDYNAE